jgi:hypothetical protein
MQNLSILQAQVESLKEMIEVMEHSNPDTLAKKWRLKVFEELVRNKQQQILHTIELKKFKEDEKKFRAKESQIKAALESAHLQASSLSLERSKLQKEVQVLQSRLRSGSFSSAFLMSLQSTFTNNLDLHSKVLSMLDAFNHRITFSMSKVKTAKILHTREIFALRNKVAEEATEQKRLSQELSRLEKLDSSHEALLYENEKLTQQLLSANERLKQAEKHAKNLLEDSNEKFKSIVGELELQLDDKVSENNQLLVQLSSSSKTVEKLKKQVQGIQENFKALQQENEILQLTQKTLQSTVNDLRIENSSIKTELKRTELSAEAFQAQQGKIQDQEAQITFLNQDLMEKAMLIQQLQLDMQKLEDELQDSESSQEGLRVKLLKLEQISKDLRKERDILIETLKKSQNKGKDEEVQTETHVNSATLKKTRAVRVDDDIN